jgi:N-acetylglucosamine kinase-like BadF-type ATPase
MYAPRPVPFVKETPIEREKLSESQTLCGAGVAGAATVGVAGIEVARQVISEAQGAVLPLVVQLEGLRWVFLALALAGIAVTAWARVQHWR